MSKKLMIEIGHPAHIHHFRNLYQELIEKDWKVLFVVKDKDLVIHLANSYQLPFKKIGKTKEGLVRKILFLPISFFKMLLIAIRFNPDIVISRVSPISGWTSFILRKPHITFTDTENVEKMDRFSEPFADYIFTSVSFKREYKPNKHFRYHGTHELAYLHASRFKPDSSVLDYLGVEKNDKYALVRFVAWDAHHDVGEYGLNENQKEEIVASLEKHMKVFISSEKRLSDKLKKYAIKIPPKKMHDAIYFATIQLGESPTMAEEAATLGVPSICISSWAGKTGVIQDLVESKLLLHFHPDNYDDLLKQVNTVLNNGNVINEWKAKRLEYLRSRIDTTAFYTWIIENYPDSINILKNNENFDKKFIRNE
jgi:uncharacterized protein